MVIPTAQNTKTITDLREDTLAILEQTKKTGPTYIFHRSRPKAVLLSIDEYANVLGVLEDYLDSLKAQELEQNPEKGGIKLEELIKKYKLNV